MRLALFTILFLAFAAGRAQAPLCEPNLDFEDGTTNYWINTGEASPLTTFTNCCFSMPGVVSVMTIGMSPDSYANIPVTAPNGSNHALKLGDFGGPGPVSANRLERPILVTATNRLLTYNYAVVIMTCGNYPVDNSAAVMLFFLDQQGDTIPCSKQYFNPRYGNIPGFTYDPAYLPDRLYYLPWQTKTLDLSGYIGQTITPVFMTKSCGSGFHSGYIYIDMVCNAEPVAPLCNGPGTLCGPINSPSYSWTLPSGAASSSSCVPIQQAGTYSLQIPAQSGCLPGQAVLTYTIRQTPVAGFSPLTTCQSLDYTFTDTGSGACNTFWTIQNTTFTASPLSHHFNTPGNYTVSMIVKDCSNTCADTIVRTITVVAPVKADFNTTAIKCAGDSLAFINTSTYTNPSAFGWDYSIGRSTSQNPKVTFSHPGTYPVKLTVSDSRGCKDSITRSVTVNDHPDIDIIFGNGCPGMLSNFHGALLNTVAVSQWEWDFYKNGTIDAQSQDASIIYQAPGSYWVKLLGTSADGCIARDSSLIQVYPSPKAMFEINPISDPEITFTNSSTTPGASTLSGAAWHFEPGITRQNPAPVVTYTYSQPGAFRPLLTVTNSFGCTDTVSHPVVISTSYAVYIPNAFTPNGDDLNDIFKIEYFGLSGYELTVFDRWGEVIFKSKDGGWDGNRRGNPCEQGVYVWRLVYTETSGAEHNKTGSVSLIR